MEKKKEREAESEPEANAPAPAKPPTPSTIESSPTTNNPGQIVDITGHPTRSLHLPFGKEHRLRDVLPTDR